MRNRILMTMVIIVIVGIAIQGIIGIIAGIIVASIVGIVYDVLAGWVVVHTTVVLL